MLRLIAVCVATAAAIPAAADGRELHSASVEELHKHYYEIFGPVGGNRNAASHLWSSFVLDRAASLTPDGLVGLMRGFCAVSGSIVRPTAYNRYRVSLRTADGTGVARGYMHYCCWPCVCDTQDFLRADTLTVATRTGPATYTFAVLGDPCAHEQQLDARFVQPFGYRETTLRREAPAIVCEDGRLQGATRSDGGHVIFAMLFDANVTRGASLDDELISPAHRLPQPGHVSYDARGNGYQDEHEYSERCADRAARGYNSGMGEIFRKVAAITPLPRVGARALAEMPGCAQTSTTAQDGHCGS
jgi:hypothetical protein